MKLVLLPGLDGTGTLFASFVAALGNGADVEVIAYPPDEAWGYREIVEFVRERLPAQPFVLLGESFSGPVAIALAARQPSILRGLILCCTFARTPHALLGLSAPIASLVPLKGMPSAFIDRLLFGRSLTPKLHDAAALALSRVSARALAARVRAVAAVDVENELARIRVPVLNLVAARDRIVPHSASERLSRKGPNVRTISIDAPHAILQTAPEAAARVIQEFVASLGA